MLFIQNVVFNRLVLVVTEPIQTDVRSAHAPRNSRLQVAWVITLEFDYRFKSLFIIYALFLIVHANNRC